MHQQAWLRIRELTNPLFIRLLLSFIFIIALLLSFFFVSFQMLKDKYHERIIAYNEMNLERTVEQYEYTFSATRNVLLNLYNKNPFVFLNAELQTDSPEINQLNVQSIYHELYETIHSNPHLMLENIYVVMQNPDSVISKNGISDSSLLFDRYIVGPSHLQDEYWTTLYEQDQLFTIFSATHTTLAGDKKTDTFALVMKNPYMKNFYMMAFIDKEAIFARYHHAFSRNFWIHDTSHNLLSGTAELAKPLDDMIAQQPSLIADSYYFNQRGHFSGLLYTDQIPSDYIDEETSQLYLLLIPVLLTAIAVSIFASVFLSRHISNPVKQILNSLHSYQDKTTTIPSSIKEFRSISQYFVEMSLKHQHADHELKASSSLLKNYAFINKLKAIKTNLPGAFKTDFDDRPFVCMVVDVYLKQHEETDKPTDEEQTVSLICELIRQSLQESSPESLTFQMMRNQISSILFLTSRDTENKTEEELKALIEPIINVLKLDEDSCIFTVGLSKVYSNSSQLTTAYDDACRIIKHRALNESLQVIKQAPTQDMMYLSSQKEQVLHGYLLSGDLNSAQQWIEISLRSFSNKQATRVQVRRLAQMVIDKIMQISHSLKLDSRNTALAGKQIDHCHTYEAFQNLLNSAIHNLIEQIRSRKDEEDELILYVTRYLDTNYHEGISLEMVADRLKITSSYLSTYFKDKTGINFKDYLNMLRMNKAKELLEKTDLKIQDIALQVGYQNTNPFIRMFRKHAGMPPGAYRKQFYD
ncbi:helix-turn-helix transcriptional regulator [Paenibacillus sp. 1P07SE]|uniref:helix-turn-helix transcriptional regulator n=1 Tax=Paenibacillus sp. 1P07SE TaxID=3132209 RepID=UPI0039A52A4F